MSIKDNKNIISLSKFLIICFDAQFENVDCLTHKDVKKIFPEL